MDYNMLEMYTIRKEEPLEEEKEEEKEEEEDEEGADVIHTGNTLGLSVETSSISIILRSC